MRGNMIRISVHRQTENSDDELMSIYLDESMINVDRITSTIFGGLSYEVTHGNPVVDPVEVDPPTSSILSRDDLIKLGVIPKDGDIPL